jgi:dolichyl-diphosphooligosaccharide--protein glycosyltransferase
MEKYHFLKKSSLWIGVLFILISAGIGLYVRYKPLDVWLHNKNFYVEGRPIFTAFDSYLYARYAEDYKNGIFVPNGEDKFRFAPDHGKYPVAIPLASWLLAEISSITGKYIEEISLWLMPLLATLTAIPIVLFFLRLDLPLTGLGGALVTLTSLIFLARTGINRLDTDALNLFFVFMIPTTVLYAFTTKDRKKKIIGLLLTAWFVILYYWWYFTPSIITALYFASIIFLVYPYLQQWIIRKVLKREETDNSIEQNIKSLISDIALLTLVFNPWFIILGVQKLIERIYSFIVAFGKPEETGFPNIMISIAELSHSDLKVLSQFIIGNEVFFLIGLVGVLVFFFYRLREGILILPVLGIGLIALKGGSRFAMYLAPFIGIGLGFWLDALLIFLKNFLKRYYSLITLLLSIPLTLGILYLNKAAFYFVPQPIMKPSLAEAFIEIGRQTPSNAVIWTWWDFGYAIQYYARRATVHDGGSQFSPKTYFVALSFTTENMTHAKNIAQTVLLVGEKGIEKLLKNYTPEEIKRKFEEGELIKGKKLSTPIYWLFTPDLMPKFYWISYFGTWDFKAKKGTHYILNPILCVPRGEKLYLCNFGGIVDFNKMVIYLPNRQVIPIAGIVERTKEKINLFKNPYSPAGIVIEKVYTYQQPNKTSFWVYTIPPVVNTTFNKLYILRVNSKLFKLIEDKFPMITVYKINN